MSSETAEALRAAHKTVQGLTADRRRYSQARSKIARQAAAEGASVLDIQKLLGLSRTGVVKILVGG